MSRATLAFAVAASLALPFAAHADTTKFHATMNAASEVPPTTSNGTGTVDATLDSATKVLTWTATWQNLTGPAAAGHFHGPAAPGANAPVLIPWTAPITSPLHGTATLTDAQIQDLKDGKLYANLHTAQNKGGEIRGQMTAQ